MPSVVTCPVIEELRGLLLGHLPAEAGERVARHLEQCPCCTAMLASLPDTDSFVEAVKNAPERLRSPDEQACVDRLLPPGAVTCGE